MSFFGSSVKQPLTVKGYCVRTAETPAHIS
jgi:hypothetical protein